MKKEKILVIGAAGQLGTELIDGLWRFYGKEHVVASDIKEPQGILAEGNFEILDVMKPKKLETILQKGEFTQVYHLAAVLSATGEKNPKSAWRLNMESLIHVLDAAIASKIQKVYWPSSIAVFGPSTPKKNTPQFTIMDPITIYGISKQAGERWCEWYWKNHGLDVRSLRYPGLIGYKSQPGGGTTDYAVEIFLKALKEKRYECFLKPDTYLPMMYMDDAVKATIDLMEAPSEKVKVRSAYNIAGMSFCPSEIAEEIKKHVPDFEITYQPDFRQGIADSWPDSIDDSAAYKQWGWKPLFSLEKMTKVMIEQLSRSAGSMGVKSNNL
jgi:nucleoside-diphosphate-sugar epimerase